LSLTLIQIDMIYFSVLDEALSLLQGATRAEVFHLIAFLDVLTAALRFFIKSTIDNSKQSPGIVFPLLF